MLKWENFLQNKTQSRNIQHMFPLCALSAQVHYIILFYFIFASSPYIFFNHFVNVPEIERFSSLTTCAKNMKLRVWIKFQLTPAHLTLLWLQGCGNCGARITSETGGGGGTCCQVCNIRLHNGRMWDSWSIKIEFSTRWRMICFSSHKMKAWKCFLNAQNIHIYQ